VADFLVYGDDSADQTQKRVCVVGIVFGPESLWEKIEPEWVERNGGIPFHARDCESNWADYKNVPKDDTKQLYADLAIMLANNGLGGFGVAVDLAAERRVFPNSPPIAYYKCFADVLQAVKEYITPRGIRAAFEFDISKENKFNAGLMYDTIRQNEPQFFEHFEPKISFAPAREYARLQVADLMAYEAMKAMDNEVGPVKRDPRKSWIALRSTGRFDVTGYSQEWFEWLKTDGLTILEKRYGYGEADYIKWLKQKKRHHDLSNLFHFTSEQWKKEKKE
jgi:hypothetical protein